MKICLIGDATSIHTYRWAQYFVHQGDEVHLITYESSKLDYKDVLVHVIPSPTNNLYLSFIPRHLRIYLIVRRLKPDIVHAHFVSKFGFHAAFLGFSPVIISAWGDDILIIPHWSRLLWHFTKLSLNRSTVIFGVSDDICKRIISEFGVSSHKVKNIPFGVDISIFRPLKTNDSSVSKTINVLSNRNFYEVYDIKTLITAIPFVVSRNENIHFVIKGTGPLEYELKSLVDKLGLSKHVTFIGWLEYEQMPKLLHQCDIYVSTAISDGTPVSLMEAMACGKPCIATDVGGISDWIEDEVSGCLIPPRNPEILASKILELAVNPDLREKLSTNAVSVIEQKGDWYRIMEDVREQYVELVKK